MNGDRRIDPAIATADDVKKLVDKRIGQIARS
jgi:hypothetical protein